MDTHVAQQCRRDRLRASYYVEESPPGDLDRPVFSSVGLGDSVAARADNAFRTSLLLCDMQSSLTNHRGSPSWKGDSNTPLALLPAYPESCLNVGMQLDSNAWCDKASNPDATAIGKAIVVGIDSGEFRNTSLTLSSNLSIETRTQNDVAMVEQHLPADITISIKGIQDVTGIYTAIPRNSGPLGPFTGYASILKSSKFLKPAQQLLHEMCGVPDSFILQTGNVLERSSEDLGFIADAAVDSLNNGCSSRSILPEYQQMKANLLNMQEEVCKRYRQYRQQMHMVFSSFHTVEGLKAATPYICFALETILRNFDFLKNAILYQLRQSKKSFGEESLFPMFGPGSNKGPPKVSKMKCVNLSFPKNKYSTADQELVLRQQRGLPEPAVIILRAWLFEHFLHPYPTDTDKHLLARQTGLSRNQVSNWFINARVRVWKPMVEEIHKLETKHQSEPCRSSMGQEDQSTRGSDMHFQRLMTQGSEQEWNQAIRVGGTSSQYQSNTEGTSMTDFTPTQDLNHWHSVYRETWNSGSIDGNWSEVKRANSHNK